MNIVKSIFLIFCVYIGFLPDLCSQEILRLSLENGSQIEGTIISESNTEFVLLYRGNELIINKNHIRNYSARPEIDLSALQPDYNLRLELYQQFFRVRNVQRFINYLSIGIIGAGIIVLDRSDELQSAILGLGTTAIGGATLLMGNLITIPIKSKKKKKIIEKFGEFDKNFKRQKDLSLSISGGVYGVGLVLNF